MPDSKNEFSYLDFKKLIGAEDVLGANQAYKKSFDDLSNAQSETYDCWSDRNDDNETNYSDFIAECIMVMKEAFLESK